MEWWTIYLAIALCILGLGTWRRDSRAAWVAGLWAGGIVLMQTVRGIGEPDQWFYAMALWAGVAMVSVLHREVRWEAFCLWSIPAGYALLAYHHQLYGAGTGAAMEYLGFTLTEVPAVLAALIGGRRMLDAPVRSLHARLHRLRPRVGSHRSNDRPVHQPEASG